MWKEAIWSEVTKVIVYAFPDVPVIPSFVNEIDLENNIPPLAGEDVNNPYSNFYELWFENIPANKMLLEA